MKEEKDNEPIDELFRGALSGYSPPPPPGVWKKVRKGIAMGRRPLWQRWYFVSGTIVIFVALLTLLGIKMSDRDDNRPELATSPLVNNQIARPDEQTQKTEPDQASGTLPSTRDRLNDQSVPTPENNARAARQEIQNKPVKTAHGSDKIAAHPLIDKSKGLNIPGMPEETANGAGTIQPEVPVIKAGMVENSESETGQNDLTNNAFPGAPTNPADKDPALIINATTENTEPPALQNLKENTPDPVPPPAVVKTFTAGISGVRGQVLMKSFMPKSYSGFHTSLGMIFPKYRNGIETGLGFTRYRDNGNYRFDYYSFDTTGYHTVSYFIPIDSSYLILYEPVISQTKGISRKSSPAYYTYLELPFFITQEIMHAGKFLLGVKAGAVAEFRISSKNSVPQFNIPGKELVMITDESFSRLSFQWQLMAAMRLSWQFSNQLALFAEPVAHYFVSNLYRKEKPGTPFGLGFGGGIQYRLDVRQGK
jgi:hypothetical protein